MTELMNRLITAKQAELIASEDVINMLATIDVFLSDGPDRRHQLAAVLALIDMEPSAAELEAMSQIVHDDHDAAIRVLALPQQRNLDFSASDKLGVIGRLGDVRDRRIGVLQMAHEALTAA